MRIPHRPIVGTLCLALLFALVAPASAVRLPAPPTRVSVTAGDMRNTITWRAPRGYRSFRVYRAAADGPFVLVTPRGVTRTWYEDAVTETGAYRYYVVGINGRRVTASSTVCANERVAMKASVGPAGATLRAANGAVTLALPAGALAATTPISVRGPVAGAEVANGIRTAPVFDLGPDGTTLARPATLTMRYDVPVSHFQVALTLERATDLATYDEARSRWTTVTASADTASGVFSGQLSHFSYWTGAVVQPHGTTPLKISYCSGVCHDLVDAPGSMTVIPSRSRTVCYTCHGNTSASLGPAGATGPNIQAEFLDAPGQSFTATSSRHPVAEGKLNCTSCHDPHVDPGASYKNLRVYDAVTGRAIRSNATTSNVGNEYCWACHGAAKNRKVDAQDPGYWARTGDRKSGFAGTPHDTKVSAPTASGIRCLGCHTDHAAANGSLIATSVGGKPVAGNDKSLCLGCHANSVGVYRGGADYSTSRHAVTTTSTKALGTAPGTAAKAGDCQNCHDPHGKPGLASYLRKDGQTLCPSCHDAAGLTYPAGYGYRGPAMFGASGHAGISAATPRNMGVDSGSPGFAAWESTIQPTPASPGTPIPASRLEGLGAVDSTVTLTSLARLTGESDYQMYRFKPGQAVSEILTMKVAWRGWGEELAGNPVTLYAWNVTLNAGAGGWQQLGSKQATNISDIATTTASVSSYVDGDGYVHVLAKAVNVQNTEIVSGPTVSGATATGMNVRWQTRGLTDSWVDVGTTTAYGSTFGSSQRVLNHDVAVTLPGGNIYHYRIRGTAKDGESYTSPDYVLAVPAPTLTDIYGFSGISADVTFQWSDPAPARDPFTYRLRVSSDQAYSYDSGWITSQTLTLAALPQGSYYWNVEARDRDGYSFGTSATDSFYIWPPSNSCPFLFVWDGTKYAFEADLNTTGKLGEKNSSGYVKPDPRDRYVIGAKPELKDGHFEMRLVEERTEVDYTDEFKVYAADVPSGVTVVAEKGDRGRALGVPPAGLHTVTDLRPPLSITRLDTGEDVRSRVATADGEYIELNEDADVGFDYKTLELDLGTDVVAAPQVKIVMNAATDRPTTPEGIARQRTFGATTKLEVQNLDGTWRSVPTTEASLPNAMEFARTYVFDVTKAMHDTTGKVRFTFLFKTYIDQLCFDTSADLPIVLTEVPMASATLQEHGLDDRDGPGPFGGMVYDRLIAPFGKYFPGRYTRYGEVKALLDATDDEFVVYGQGDELVMRFDVPAKPDEGMSRSYVAFIDGYYKGTKSAVPSVVDPLPFAAMSNYPYPDTEAYPTDWEHSAYRAEYNTREYDASGTLVPSAVTGGDAFVATLRDVVGGLVRALAAVLDRGQDAATLAEAPALHRSLNTDFIGLEFELKPSQGIGGECTVCHAVHGATDWDGQKLGALRAAPDGRTCTAAGTGTCHSAPATQAAGINIYAKVTAAPTDPTAHHDVLDSQQAVSGSRVSCGDCHNPHSDDATSTFSDVDNRSQRGKSDFAKYFDASGRMLVMVAARHDGAAPAISGLAVDVNAAGPTAPVVRWTTDEAATTFVDYGRTTAYELGSIGSATLTSSHVATMTGLAYGSGYYFRIRSADALGNETLGAQQYYEPVAPPAAPALSPIPSFDVNLDVEGAHSITATWTPVASTDGGTVQYEVEVVNTTSSGWIAATSWTSPNVFVNGTYTVRVRARNTLHPLGYSAWSNPVTFTATNVTPLPASCPDLFTWDGDSFEFVTDVMNNGCLGLRVSNGEFLLPRPYEETRIDPSLLKPRDGRYELRMRDNNDEMDYVDSVKLKVVDHPKGTQVYLNDFRYSASTGTVDPQRIYTVRDPKPIVRASYTNIPLFKGVAVEDQDVTDDVARVDNEYAPASIYDDNRYVFGLGDLRGAPAIKLVMTGWSEYPYADEAAERNAMRAPAAPQVLEVQRSDGTWVPVQDPAGFIPGYTKTVVYDLTKEFGPRVTDFRVRLRGLVRTHIDQVLVDTSPNEPVTVREVDPVSAALSFVGPSPVALRPAPRIDYGTRRIGEILLHRGMFTKFGDVLPLTAEADDRFVVMDTGDELALSFPVPAATPDTDRTCLIAADGYFQLFSRDVEPLPFHDMSTYPYRSDEHYPNDDDHAGYRSEWNTRLHRGEAVSASTGLSPAAKAGSASTARLMPQSFGRMAMKRYTPAAGTLDTVLQGIVSWQQRLLGSLRTSMLTFSLRPLAAEEPAHLSANTDAISVRVSRVDDVVTTYTPVAAWESAGTTMSVPSSSAPGAAVPAATLAKAVSVDATHMVTALTAVDSQYNRQVFAFDVPGTKRQATKDVLVSWRGHGEPTPGYENIPVYVWNFETDGWDKLAEDRAVSDTTIGRSIEGVGQAYCLECHDGTPRQGVVLAGIVNVGARWGTTPANADRHGDFAGTGKYGYYYTGYSTLGRLAPGYARGQAVACVTCHDPHGNANPYHLQKTVNGNTNLQIREQGSAKFCKSCHVGTVREFHEPCATQCHYGESGHYDDITYLLPNESSDCLACHKHGKGWGHTPGCGHEGCESDWYYYESTF